MKFLEHRSLLWQCFYKVKLSSIFFGNLFFLFICSNMSANEANLHFLQVLKIFLNKGIIDVLKEEENFVQSLMI